MKKVNKIRLLIAIKYPFTRAFLLSAKEHESLLIAELKEIALLFGHNITGWSNGEVKAAVYSSSKLLAEVGIKASEAGAAFAKSIK